MFKEVPEYIIKESAVLAADSESENNTFIRLLEAAEKYKEAKLTPVYILNTTTMEIAVVAKEMLNKKLH
jgi:hypothetical protein